MRVTILSSYARLAASIIGLCQGVDGIEITHHDDYSCDTLLAIADPLPDMVIVDVSSRGSAGLGIVYDIRCALPTCGIIAVGMYKSRTLARSLAECGADVFILTENIPRDVLKTIARIKQRAENLAS